MPGMDHEESRLLGEIKGSLEALRLAFQDERDLRRRDSTATSKRLDKIDDLESESEDLRKLLDQLKRQTYSTKAEVDKMKAITSKIAGIIVVLSLLGSLVLSGIYWVVTHPTEIYAFVKGLTAGKP